MIHLTGVFLTLSPHLFLSTLPFLSWSLFFPMLPFLSPFLYFDHLLIPLFPLSEAAVLPPLAEPLAPWVPAPATAEGQSPGPTLLGSGSRHTGTGPTH